MSGAAEFPPGSFVCGTFLFGAADAKGERVLVYDVAIIGAGVIGCSLARELSRYRCSVALVEKENDVAMGTTRANSAIIHAGYDPEPGTLMAKYNVEGNRLAGDICEELDVPFRRCGSFVLAFDEGDMKTVRHLYENGLKNGVPGVRVLTAAEVKAMEPNVSDEVAGALYAPSAGIINPWEFALAMAENAVENGVKLVLNFKVSGLEKDGDVFALESESGERLEARFVVNCAGVHSDEVAGMAGDRSFSIDASKGQYYLLDKSQGGLFDHVMFQCPGPLGKGVLVSPTIHGNLIVGPDAIPGSPRDNVGTDRKGLAYVMEHAKKMTGAINFRENIRNFAGLRSQPSTGDFIVGPSEADSHFFNIAGIKSPGLSCAPAIAADVKDMLLKAGVPGEEKENVVRGRRVVRFRDLGDGEKAEVIKKDPAYGRVICRCETITEGEIVACIHSPIPPVSIDGVKRRCNAGMGRCQGGFCGPRVLEILSRELGIPPEQVMKDRAGSYVLLGKTQKGGDR